MSGMFSTKGRYALRAMADLASHDGWVSLGDVAQRQNISRKYLEQIISIMHKAGFVESQRGKGGGYRLAKKPEEYTVSQILHTAEGDFNLVPCPACDDEEALAQRNCPENCPASAIWRGLGDLADEYLEGKTLADLI